MSRNVGVFVEFVSAFLLWPSTLLIPVHIWAVVVVTQLSSAYLIAVWWVGEARNPFKDAGRAVGLIPERG